MLEKFWTNKWQYAKSLKRKPNMTEKTLTDAFCSKLNLRLNKKLRIREFFRAKWFNRKRCVSR